MLLIILKYNKLLKKSKKDSIKKFSSKKNVNLKIDVFKILQLVYYLVAAHFTDLRLAGEINVGSP